MYERDNCPDGWAPLVNGNFMVVALELQKSLAYPPTWLLMVGSGIEYVSFVRIDSDCALSEWVSATDLLLLKDSPTLNVLDQWFRTEDQGEKKQAWMGHQLVSKDGFQFHAMIGQDAQSLFVHDSTEEFLYQIIFVGNLLPF